jgi:hypothetical protein
MMAGRLRHHDGATQSESLPDQLLHQTILQRIMSALDAPLRLAGIGAQNLDVEL